MLLHKLSTWRQEVDRLKVSQVAGCLYVDSKQLKAELGPAIDDASRDLLMLLLDMARQHCLHCLEDLQDRVALLQVTPGAVPGAQYQWLAVLGLTLLPPGGCGGGDTTQHLPVHVCPPQARPTTLDEFMGYTAMHRQQLEDRKAVTDKVALVRAWPAFAQRTNLLAALPTVL